MGQPALSELIRRLERELGVALFIRTTQRVTLTAAGEELLIRAKVILDEVAAASAAVRRVAGARRERCGLASPRRRPPCSRRTCARYSPWIGVHEPGLPLHLPLRLIVQRRAALSWRT